MRSSMTKQIFERQDIVDFGNDGPERKVQLTFTAGELQDMRMALRAAEHYFADNPEPGYEKWVDATAALSRFFFDAETWANGGRK